MIIHLIGPMCSGKSYVIKRLFYENINLVAWDIKECFYKPLGILNLNDNLDEDMFTMYKDYIWFAFHLFFQQNKDKTIILESSGTNRYLNSQLSYYKDTKIVPVFLRPTEEDLQKQITLRGTNKKVVEEFNKHFHKKIDPLVKHFNFKWMDQEEVYNYISNLLGEENENISS